MKKVLLIVGTCAAAFLVGSLGIYYGMPVLDPERAEKVTRLVDSLMEHTSTDLIPSPPEAVDPPAVRLELDSMSTVGADSVAQDRTGNLAHVVELLRDSLATLVESLERATAESVRLRAEIASLPATSSAAINEAEPVVAQLSQTLSRLDDKELRPILNNLRISTLEALYAQASTRDRRRLVANMPTQKAAQLVARQVHGSTASIESDQAAESPDPN